MCTCCCLFSCGSRVYVCVCSGIFIFYSLFFVVVLFCLIGACSACRMCTRVKREGSHVVHLDTSMCVGLCLLVPTRRSCAMLCCAACLYRLRRRVLQSLLRKQLRVCHSSPLHFSVLARYAHTHTETHAHSDGVVEGRGAKNDVAGEMWGEGNGLPKFASDGCTFLSLLAVLSGSNLLGHG